MSIKKKILGTFATSGLSLVFGIISSIVISRLLGAQGRGEQAMFTNSSALVFMLFDLGLQASIIFHISRFEYHPYHIIRTYFLYALVVAVVFLLGIPILYHAGYLETLLFPAKYYSLSTTAFYAGIVFFLLFNSSIKAVLNAARLIGNLNIISLVIQGTTIATYIVLYYLKSTGYFQSDSLDIFHLTTMMVVLEFLLVSYVLIRAKGLDSLFKFELLERKTIFIMCAWGLWPYISSFCQFLSYRIDFWFVNYYRPRLELGEYSLASNLAQMIWMIPAPFAVVFFPYISSNDGTISDAKILQVSRILFSILIVLGVVGVGFSSILIPGIYGHEFAPSVILFNILMIGTVPLGLIKVYAIVLGGKNKVKYNFVASVAGLVMTMVLDIMLIPRFGAKGASVASAISYITTSAIVVYYITRVFEKDVLDVLILKRGDILFMQSILKNIIIAIKNRGND